MGVCVLLYQVEQGLDHFGLGPLALDAIKRIIGFRLEVRIMLGQIGVQPDLGLPIFIEKDHFLRDIKEANLLIQNFESLQASVVQINLIVEGNVIDFLESQLHLCNVQQPSVNCRTQLLSGSVGEVAHVVDVGGIFQLVLVCVTQQLQLLLLIFLPAVLYLL